MYRHGMPIDACDTKNISAGGDISAGGLETDSSQFIINTIFHVEFYFDRQDEQLRYRVPVMVVHKNESGIGVICDTSDLSIYHGMQQLLHERLRSDYAGVDDQQKILKII
ncbi:MAG: hypothetical protein ACE5EH_06530 [Gammaproteobacteria bacterium]